MTIVRYIFLFFGIIILSSVFVLLPKQKSINATPKITTSASITPYINSPLAISLLRRKDYPGSNIVFEQTLPQQTNYNQYIVSYLSDGLKIYALMTIPIGQKPSSGWPVILLNHGYIPPFQYQTESSYESITASFAKEGYIVFKPDYRGNGKSEGKPTQVYVSPDYITDSLNALSSVAKYKNANPKKIGIWGHSMGGNITLHELVIAPNLIKAAVLWSGVVGSYSDILDWWNKRIVAGILVGNDLDTAQIVKQFVLEHSTPQENPAFWNEIDPTYYIQYITSPIQIQVGTNDTVVPYQFSENLKKELLKFNKNVKFYEYQNADHNLSPDQSAALDQSISFFNQYLK